MAFKLNFGRLGEFSYTGPANTRNVEYTKDKNGHVYTLQSPNLGSLYRNVLRGSYSKTNLITLFNTIPEIYAPVNEIAARVAQANWQLCSIYSDAVDYRNQGFNRIFDEDGMANWMQSIKDFIWQAVCYELVTGEEYLYFHNLNGLTEEGGMSLDTLEALWNLQSQYTEPYYKNPYKLYSSTEPEDVVERFETPDGAGGTKSFAPAVIAPIIRHNLNWTKGPLEGRSPLLSAEKAITNLIQVYEARGTIYLQRGALGMIVSKKSDESGNIALTPKEKDELIKDYNSRHGFGEGKSPTAITNQPVDFIQMGMTIKDLEPFVETSADASAIYACLRVPKHLQPHLENSTYDNAASDMKSFYSGTIIPLGNKYAGVFTKKLNTRENTRWIRANYDHIPETQEDRVKKTSADKTEGETWKQRWDNGLCTLNEWIASWNGTPGTVDIYKKKKYELTPDELTIVNPIIAEQNQKPGQNGNSSKADSSKSN